MKFYLSTAVLLLIAITSLGIYGYLSDAFNKTSTRVALYESNIEQLHDKNAYLKNQIESVNQAADTVDDKATQAISNFQEIYDKFIERQDSRKEGLASRLAALDEERNQLEASPGGLFSSKKKKLEELAIAQKSERDSITTTLVLIDTENKEQYDSFLSKVEDLRNKTGEVDVREDVESYYDQIKTNEEKVLELRELIGNTDIGSFKFIAKTFDMELEQVVKWFMIVIVIVFDPLAVCLVIGYNSMLTGRDKKDVLVNKNKTSRETEDVPIPLHDPKDPKDSTKIENLVEEDFQGVIGDKKPEKQEVVKDDTVDINADTIMSEMHLTNVNKKLFRKKLRQVYSQRGSEGLISLFKNLFK